MKYVSNINVSDRYKKFIAAGTPFIKEVLVLHTFESLKGQGHISEYSADSPIVPVKGPKGKMLASIPGTTPDAAIFPPTLSQEQREENAKQTAIAIKKGKVATAEKNAAKEVEKVDKAEANLAEEEAAKIALDEAEAKTPAPPVAEETKESTVKQIWIADPVQIKNLKFEQLLSSYRSQCKEYSLVPEKFETKELLIAKLSSQFKK